MYEKQKLRVKLGNHSDMFKVCNGVMQGGVLSPVLFEELFERLAKCGHGCHVGIVFVGCIAYADYIKIIVPLKERQPLISQLATASHDYKTSYFDMASVEIRAVVS